MSRLIDTHSHLHFPGYDTDRADVLHRMEERDISTITVGTTASTSLRAVELAEASDRVWAAVAHHPEHLTSAYIPEDEPDAHHFDIEKIAEIARSSKRVVAIGETGLDFYRIDAGVDRKAAEKIQESALRDHLALARELDLPVIFHCREALTRLTEIIHEEQEDGRPVQGVIHCFGGTWEDAEPLLDAGLYLSFAGIVTFPLKKTQDPESHVHRVIERMPIERLLVETDAPFLTPAPFRGQRNEPTYVEYVARKVAELRHISEDDVRTHTTTNARALFRRID